MKKNCTNNFKMNNFKKITLGLVGATILSFGLYACSNDDVTQETEQNPQTQVVGKSLETAVSSMRIDNGLTSLSENNILVFESKETLEEVFNQIIQEYDQYNENLDKQIPEDLVDDELEDFIVKNNLDEDYTLNDFEKNLGFKSLRKVINEAEAIWLDNQGEVMNIDTDPDNHFIISDFERTLLNEGSELIIKNNEKEPIIFKYFEWGHIEISDLNTDLLKEINTGNIRNPETLEALAQSKSFLEVFRKNKDGNIISSCRKSGKKVDYHYFNGKQIKSFTSQNQGIFDRTLVAKTKGYQWKKGKWKNKKIWIHAGISGLNRGDWKISNNCGADFPGSAVWKDKKRYKLEYRLPNNPYLTDITVKNNGVYSYHSEGGTSFFVDFYDYNAVQW